MCVRESFPIYRAADAFGQHPNFFGLTHTRSTISPIVCVMDYRNYIQSDHWKNLRLKKIRITKKCFGCGSTVPPDVHHVRYKNLTDVNVHDLKRVCQPCHALYHAIEDANPSMRGKPAVIWRRVKRHNAKMRALEKLQRNEL